MFKKLSVLALAMIISLSITACNSKENKANDKSNTKVTTADDSKEKETLFVYSGAGLKKPMDEIAKKFEKENNVKVEYSYAGSAQLIAQIETSHKGDVFIVGSEPIYSKAFEKELVGEHKTVAHHTPAIVVPKGNPANIQKLEDLNKDGVKLILGDKESNAIGKTTQKILEKNNLKSINDNVVSTAATVNEMIVQLTSSKADATIATKDSVFGNEDVEVIEIAQDKNIDQLISAGIVNYSDKKDLANKFINYIESDEAKQIFKKYGFEPVK
ncbi:TPA: molybdate ABC transporter substrate-binding protein [Clostridioides difficile]|nr:molybdate ABC transporter substrate-binding protein [Clostridioides difficile]HCQ5729468.1 molybdate ABC transporter substrate-binding protein [Clostridioides difficile]HCQ5820771.1 molybdate ABC transporter substrate-binding protein [Clostridioides difficile]